MRTWQVFPKPVTYVMGRYLQPTVRTLKCIDDLCDWSLGATPNQITYTAFGFKYSNHSFPLSKNTLGKAMLPLPP